MLKKASDNYFVNFKKKYKKKQALINFFTEQLLQSF